MRSLLLLLLFSLGLPLWVFGEINTHITDFPAYYGSPPGGGPRPYLGSFSVQNLPEPLKECRVGFNFEVVRDDWPFADSNWTLRVEYPQNIVSLVSDSMFYWPGPHKNGDVFNGGIDFIPLVSGQYMISVVLNLAGESKFDAFDLGFCWCLDEDGNLGYLGKPRTGDRCAWVSAFYFEENTLRMPRYGYLHQDFPFDYCIEMSPIPQIGDTGIIHVDLTAIRDLSGGCDIEIYAECIDVIKLPERIDYTITRGQNVELETKVVFNAVNAEHKLFIAFFDPTPINKRHDLFQRIRCFFQFGADGALRYASYGNFSSLSEEKKSTHFRNINKKSDLCSVKVKANGEIEYKWMPRK